MYNWYEELISLSGNAIIVSTTTELYSLQSISLFLGDAESPDFPQKAACSASFNNLNVQWQPNRPAKPGLLQHSGDPGSRAMTWPVLTYSGSELIRVCRRPLIAQAWSWEEGKKNPIFKQFTFKCASILLFCHSGHQFLNCTVILKKKKTFLIHAIFVVYLG